MPATLQVGQAATCSFKEWTQPNGGGVEIAPIGPVVFSSSDPTVATVDPATGNIKAVGVGVVTITATDNGNQLSATDSVTGVPSTAKAVSATLLVTPV
jgi:uncharacterized protein YjdB